MHSTGIKAIGLLSGGFITFGPGYNAANAIAEDLEIEKWWSEPELVTEYRKKGYA